MTEANLRSEPARGFPSRGTIYDRAKLPVDASGWVWRLNHVSTVAIDFRRLGIASPGLLDALVGYVAHLVEVSSVDNVRNTFEALRFLQHSEHFRHCQAAGGGLDLRLIVELRSVPRFGEWRLHYVRAWYRWCAERNLPQFSAAVADELDEIRIPGNLKGVAVRIRDPEQGALDQMETIALVSRLKEIGPEVLTLSERVLIWLALAFGCNPLAFGLLREEDYEAVREVGSDRVHHVLRIPRVKKRRPFFRGAWHVKRPNHVIGELVAALIAENVAYRREHGWPEGCAFPLFRRPAPRVEQLGSPMHEYAMHRDDLTPMLKAAVAKLDVISHRTGRPINITMMRFRRTFATRAVEENVAPNALAVMVDHTDLQNIKVYYETRSSIVDRLDAAMAVKLGPLADAFMGKVVCRGEAGDTDPAKAIPWFRRGATGGPQRADDLGTCATRSSCREFAPISCYTCRKFRPWRDGPHREILQELCNERGRREADGLDPQIVGLYDATILAIGGVVAACDGEKR